jgi:hypothetical protein
LRACKADEDVGREDDEVMKREREIKEEEGRAGRKKAREPSRERSMRRQDNGRRDGMAPSIHAAGVE